MKTEQITVMALCDFVTQSRGKRVLGKKDQEFTGHGELIEHLFDLGYVAEIEIKQEIKKDG